jgi:hypothetical protein
LAVGIAFLAPILAGCSTVLTQLGVTSGWAVVSWTPPTTTANGSALTDLAGYELFYGRRPSELKHIVKIPDVHVTRMIVRGLDSGTWYFVVTAYTRSGAMSFPSNVASKAIP